MNTTFNFKKGDYVIFTDTYNNDYVDIIGDYNPENNSVEEIVSVMYMDRNGGEEEGFIYYRTTLFLDAVKEMRLATKDEVNFLNAVLMDDDNKFDKDKMEVVSRETVTKKTFHLTRTVILGGYYQDTIDVEAENLEIALNKATEFNSSSENVWATMDKDEIIMDESDIKRIEISDANGEEYREINF